MKYDTEGRENKGCFLLGKLGLEDEGTDGAKVIGARGKRKGGVDFG